MSQSRVARKQPVSIHGDTLLRSRCPITKASGDTRTGPNQANHRSRSKNKIPKSLRYDLENALVGLCDVWFEEIKPHLLRNNIKVHVHGAMQSGIAGVPSGDPASGLLPPGAPGCSHVDPATSAFECELCRLLYNAANSIESAVSQAAGAGLCIATPEGDRHNNQESP